MPESKAHQIKGLQFRAHLPAYFRYAAIGVFAVALLVVMIGFYRSRDPEFRMKGFPTSLSKDVIAAVEGYERRETEDGVLKYYIKADKATTFADNHQELENVYLQVFAPGGETFDQITAAKAVYLPEEDKNFTAYFAGAVDIQTRDSLHVRTEQVTYKRSNETISVEDAVTFQRDNLKGSAVGAEIDMAGRRLDLLREVKIDSMENADSDVRRATLSAGSATYDQGTERITLDGGLTASVFPHAGNTRKIDVSSSRGTVHLAEAKGVRDFTKLELFEAVRINSAEPGTNLTKISAGYALYDKLDDRFDLRKGVEITTVEDEKPTVIRSAEAVYSQSKSKVTLFGGGELVQGDDLIKGDTMVVDLYPDRKVKFASAKGSSYLRQSSADRKTEVTANELNASMLPGQILSNAHAFGSVVAVLHPANTSEYARVTMSAPKAINLLFAGAGLLSQVDTEGRTTILLDSASNDPASSNKKLTADSVKTSFDAEGKNIQKAEAVGSAELIVDPLNPAPGSYLTKIVAPRFDCEFYPTGNNAKICTAATKTRTERTPKVPSDTHGLQVMTSDRLVASFSHSNKDIERLEALGAAKFTELDRNASAGQILFTNADGKVALRGGEPTVWDSAARAKATEIDWDTRAKRSYLRGNVSTTYYSQRQTGSAAPFGGTDKPVFVTAAAAEIDHQKQTAVYSGNARGWQEKNFVRGDTIAIFQREGVFNANGSVQSLLYNATRKENGKEITVPVFASSQKLDYNRDERVLRYKTNVDIRQGSDRITGGAANVFLTAGNEVAKTDMEQAVVITQPNRRAVADFATYTQADESVILRGNPARVEDAENGSSQGSQLTLFLRSNRIESEGKSRLNAGGRTRSVYKVKSN